MRLLSLAKRWWGPTIAKTLIIEDDPQTALYVTEGLQNAGHVVHWAATGADGFHQAVAGDFAAIGDQDTLEQEALRRLLAGADCAGACRPSANWAAGGKLPAARCKAAATGAKRPPGRPKC